MAQKIVKYVGRTTDFSGKTLWEIVGNLKDYGVGRIIIRNMFQRYAEPCYMKILKVEAHPNPSEPLEDRKVDIWVEQVFRGVRHPHPLNMLNVSFKTDFRLIPKHEEAKFTSYPVKELADAKTTTLPQTMDFPPLLERYIAKETGNQHPQLKVLLNRTKHNLNRYAEIGEEPTVKFPKNMGLGQPRSPNLYKNCGLTFDNQETK